MMEQSKRYDRQIALPEIGISGQQKLAAAKVLIVGAGGLGCPVLQSLAAAGVGQIGIVDGDVIAESNLHRQFLFTAADCKKNKAQVAAMAALRQNPEVKVFAFPHHFTQSNAAEIIQNYQLVVDCTDDNHSRYLINDVALAKGIPMVSASIHKFEGQLSVFNYQGGPTYRCLFGSRDEKLDGVDCTNAGVLGILPQTLGALQATEVLKMILGVGEVLSGKLLLYDGLQNKFSAITFDKNPTEVAKGVQTGNNILHSRNPLAVGIGADAFWKALQMSSHLVVDIRENYEEPRLENQGIHNVPLSQLEHFIDTVAQNQKVILFCQRGHQSQMASDYLTNKGFQSIFHLQNGIEGLTLNAESHD